MDGKKEYLIRDNGEKIDIFRFHGDLLNYRQWDAYAWWGFFSLTLTGLLIPVVEYILPFLSINLFPKIISPPSIVNFNRVIFGFSFISFFTYGIFKMISNIDENGYITLDNSWQFFGFGLWWVSSHIICRILASESKKEELKTGEDPSVFVIGILFGLLPFCVFYLLGAPSGLLLSGLIAIFPQSFGISLIRLNTPNPFNKM